MVPKTDIMMIEENNTFATVKNDSKYKVSPFRYDKDTIEPTDKNYFTSSKFDEIS